MGECVKNAKFQPGLATYKALENEDYEFYVESFGQMPAIEIVKKALDTLKKELKEVHECPQEVMISGGGRAWPNAQD